MEKIRKPFQGVFNILRFNWHFYVIGFIIVFLLLITASHFNKPLQFYVYTFCAFALGSTLISLLISFFIYDVSELYKLKWIKKDTADNLIVTINAGFDETSHLLKNRFKDVEFIMLDFYDPLKHTEVSIKRARAAYPPPSDTRSTETTKLALKDNSVDKVFVILAAHEIRNEAERVLFFKELNRIIKPTGQIYITEHLRDLPNFLAYTVGFFHFYSKNSWHKTFKKANLIIKQELKITPFISTFILNKNGNTL